MSKTIATLLLPAILLPAILVWAPPASAGGARRAAKAEPDQQPDQQPGEQADAVGTLSRSGTRRGGLEFGLGSLLLGTSGALIGFGVSQFRHARQQAEFCAMSGDSAVGIDPCTFDPPPLGYASAGLSWGFSALLVVGGGLLFARGARVRADARAFDRLQLSVFGLGRGWSSGGGAALRLRF